MGSTIGRAAAALIVLGIVAYGLNSMSDDLLGTFKGTGKGGMEKALAEFDKLKAGMSMDEVTALLGKPSKRTDGPQVSYPGQSGPRGQVVEVLSGGRLWSSRDPAEAEIVSLLSSGASIEQKQPSNFGDPLASDGGGKVNWLYGASKTDASRIIIAFVDGKLASADLFKVPPRK